MDPTIEHPIFRFRNGQPRSQTDRVIAETRIVLNINDGQLQLAMLALPQELEALAVGFLLGEGALRRREDLTDVQIQQDPLEVHVRGEFDADVLENIHLRWTWGTGCGGGGTARDIDAAAIAPVADGPTVSCQELIQLAGEFTRRSTLWQQTGGVHACGLADQKNIVMFAEDVGRHNAFDKVIGQAFLEKIDLCDKFLLTTGRISADIVSKAIACRLAILVSRSAVTSLAIQAARRFGMTLVGFLRGGRFSVYTGYQRIVEATKK